MEPKSTYKEEAQWIYVSTGQTQKDSFSNIMWLFIVLFHMALAVDCCLHDGCDCSSTTVICESVGLSSLVAVKYLPSDTNTMVITGNSIDEITKKSFFNLTQLHTIYLQKNNIAKLNIGSFESAPVLKLLNLSSNRMTSIVDGTFRGLDRLTFLDLTNNEITALEENAFKELLSLSELYLSDNGLANIPNGVFASLHNLNHLKLNGNKMVTLPDGVFSTLNKLAELYLSYNRLHTITSAQFEGLGKLERLDMQGNRLLELDPAATEGENLNRRACLQTSDLPQSQFHQPGLLSGLKQLKHLDISNNSLTTMSALSFISLRKLTLLKVSANHWRCDCKLKRTLFHMRQEHDDDVPRHHHVICWLPVKLRGVSIDDLKFVDLEDFANTTRRKKISHSSVLTNQPTTLSTAEIQTKKTFSSDLSTTFNVLLGTSGQRLSPNKPPAWSRQPVSFPTFNLRQNAATATSHDRVDATADGNRFRKLENKSWVLQFNKRNNNLFDYSDTEDFPPYEENKPALQQNELISWLMLVAAIFTVFAVVVCGVAFKRKHDQEGGSLCGCCFGSDKTSGPYPSDSVRSFSNYPLLYDNPLARRPLPRQPAVTRRDHRNQSLSAMSALQNGIDVRWTCGGSFGIGDSRPRSVIPGRFISRLGAVCTPPIIPPRDPLDSSLEDEDTGSSNSDRTRASTRREELHRHLHLMSNNGASAASLSDISTLSPPLHSYSNRRSLQIHVIEKEKRLKREGPRSSSEKSCRRQPGCVSNSVSRNGSDVSRKSRHLSKRSTKRDHDMALEVLDEGKTARHNKRDNYSKVHCNRRSRAPKTASIGSKMLLEIPPENKYRTYLDDNCLLGSVAPRKKVRRGASARYCGEKPVDYFYQQSNNRKVNAKSNKYSPDCKITEVSSVRRSQSMNHNKRMDEVDFKFPPPPPLLNISSEAGSQAESLSLSEKSYNLNLPSPLPCGDGEFDTPTLIYRDSSSSLSSNDVRNYSILALCSSGHKDDANLTSKSTHKSERKFRSALHCRLDSVDSMHASRDTNCESLSEDSSADFDNNKIQAFDEVVYRDPKPSLDVPRYKHDHRKSMPIFDEVMRYAQPSYKSSLAASEITCMGSDSFINKSVSRYPKYHQLLENRSRRLDLSLTDSEWETTVAGSQKILPTRSQHGRSTSGSSDNKPLPEATQETESNSYKTKLQRRQFSGLFTKQSWGSQSKSESSQGSQSVSSIEFETRKLDENGDRANTYQALHQMYSGEMLQSTKPADSRENKSRLRAPPPRLLINAGKSTTVDVAGSSTDDVSTDIEMLDLGPA